MLEFLQTGKALYVLAAVCGMGVLSKLMTSSLYKRLIRETGNIALTKNKNLRLLKQRTEGMFLLSHGIRNAGAYIEKQLYGFRFMNISLDVWENVSVQAMLLCFLLGGIAAFGAYWYRCDSYYIVLYGTMGILSGLLLVLVDNGANISLKRQQLMDALVDYVENSPHFYKAGAMQELAGTERRLTGTVGEQKERLREMGRNRGKMPEGNKEAAAADMDRECGVNRMEKEEETANVFHAETNSRHAGRSFLSKRKRQQQPVLKVPINPAIKSTMKADMDTAMNSEAKHMGSADESLTSIRREDGRIRNEDQLAKSIHSLKESLDQIAASRDRDRRDLQVVKLPEHEKAETAETVKKELSAEDLKFLGELLQEYLT